jgi:hypothetical protein
MAAGAALGNMREAWWVPVVEIPGDEAFGRPRARLVLRERTLPRSIMVNRQGRRFGNEAANYNALGAGARVALVADNSVEGVEAMFEVDGQPGPPGRLVPGADPFQVVEFEAGPPLELERPPRLPVPDQRDVRLDPAAA